MLTAFTAAALTPLPAALFNWLTSGGSLYGVPEASAQSGAFQESFVGAPSSPQPWRPSTWEVVVHSRDPGTWSTLDPMNAEHGSDCAPPPATHETSAYESAVFLCRDHVMTAINADGYGVIYLTPNHMVDFSTGEAVIRFSMSTQRHSDRDWVDLWITPFEDNLVAPLEEWLPDLSGEPRRAIHVRMDATNDGTMFRTRVICNFGGGCGGASSNLAYESFLTPSSTRRDTFELRISRTHIRFGMPAYNQWWQDIAVPDIGWTRGIVQLGHHSYTPFKGSCLSGGCGPSTWHWDDVNISPAVPFTMLHADRRFTDANNPAVSFPGGAPANSFLRFAGIGQNLSVSFDGGTSWQPAQLQAQEKHQDELFDSYWMPVPAGTSNVRFRGDRWFAGNWRARDISIWSSNASSTPPAPMPAPTATPPPAATSPAVPTTTSPGGTFSCTQFIGYSQTSNWFSGLESVVPSGSYQLLWNGGGAMRLWADPNYSGWSNSIQSPCTSSSSAPDRIVLDITNDGYLTSGATGGDPVGHMENIIRNAISTVRARYPSVEQIVLQPIVGGPSHNTCPWSGAEQGVVRATYNHPIIHQAAMRAVGGDVVFGPDNAVRTCTDYADSIGHLTSGSQGPIGQSMGSFFAVTSSPAPTAAPAPAATPAPTATRTAPAPNPDPISAGNRIPWQGGSWYLLGANVPWLNWACDFGCGANGGVSSPSSQAELSRAFAELRASGAHTVRWWMFEGNAWQINRDSSGAPTTLNEAVYTDVDAALQLASTHDLYIDFVLFSNPSHLPSSWLTDPGRTRLVAALRPLFSRYQGSPRIVSWEVFNEPEFDIWNGNVSQGAVQATVRAIAEAVHSTSSAYVTVGSAMLDALPLWVGQGLDYYQVHWYPYMDAGTWCVPCTDYATVRARFGLDAPLVIGELYAGPDAAPLNLMTDLYASGYAGAWAWSLFPDRTNDGLAIDMSAVADFSRARSDIGPRLGPLTALPTPASGVPGQTATPVGALTPPPLQTGIPTTVSGGPGNPKGGPTPIPNSAPFPAAMKTPVAPKEPNAQVVSFNDLTGSSKDLNWRYPSGLIEWGVNVWSISGPFDRLTTKNITFKEGGRTSGSFRFVAPKRLASIQADNGGPGPATITVSCPGNGAKSVVLGAGQTASIDLGWLASCTNVTLASTSGSRTHFDNFVYYDR